MRRSFLELMKDGSAEFSNWKEVDDRAIRPEPDCEVFEVFDVVLDRMEGRFLGVVGALDLLAFIFSQKTGV